MFQPLNYPNIQYRVALRLKLLLRYAVDILKRQQWVITHERKTQFVTNLVPVAIKGYVFQVKDIKSNQIKFTLHTCIHFISQGRCNFWGENLISRSVIISKRLNRKFNVFSTHSLDLVLAPNQKYYQWHSRWAQGLCPISLNWKSCYG